jgi:hypothetical protein
MTQTIRKYWGKNSGRQQYNLNWPAIDQDSVVLVTASEYNDQTKARFRGDASITVSSIDPHGPPYDPNHGVNFYVNINSSFPINLVTDITVLNTKPIEVQTYTPPTPNNIGLRMQFQQSNNWCWIAVGTSISHYYNSSSTWRQCAVMTDIGHRINNFPADTSACPSSAVVNANPNLVAALADPYSMAAEFILDNTLFGVDQRYLKTGWVGDALKTVGCFASHQPASLSLDALAVEIRAGRPVVAEITWLSNSSSHFVAIAGVLNDSLLVLDPANGTSVIRWKNFPATYFGGAKVDGFDFTKKS